MLTRTITLFTLSYLITFNVAAPISGGGIAGRDIDNIARGMVGDRTVTPERREELEEEVTTGPEKRMQNQRRSLALGRRSPTSNPEDSDLEKRMQGEKRMNDEKREDGDGDVDDATAVEYALDKGHKDPTAVEYALDKGHKDPTAVEYRRGSAGPEKRNYRID